MKRVGIIGGGASGLVAAIAAARNGAQVTVLEHTGKFGKKLLATGNGRCNLTNNALDAKHYPGNPDFALQVIEGFDREATCEFFEKIGIITWCNPEGYVYPRSLQASSVVNALICAADHLGVKLLGGVTTTGISAKNTSDKERIFSVQTDKGLYEFDRLILACGSKASPNTGSDGSGYHLAKSLGLNLTPIVPALVPLTSSWKGFKVLSGVRVKGKIDLLLEGKLIASDEGELQLTDYGISGIPVFQVSRYAAYACLEKGINLEARLDFFPEYSFNELLSLFHRQTISCGHIRCGDFLSGLLPEKLGRALLKLSKIDYEMAAEDLDNRKLRLLSQNAKSFCVPITGTLGFDRAQICAGGVQVSELSSKTMECKRIPGLYIVGELVDVDGVCGGYNLQFAWSSGSLAGKAAALK